ncbi:hypothetical protein Mapa_002676 [Marchantia paleacea]|nr:hypothetical protein Mapa_002676 [Marchantia paleacea]
MSRSIEFSTLEAVHRILTLMLCTWVGFFSNILPTMCTSSPVLPLDFAARSCMNSPSIQTPFMHRAGPQTVAPYSCHSLF